MPKKYLDINVHDAAIERIGYLFDEFDNVLVAFSGGKDSSVALELCYDYAKEHGCLDRMGMYYMDFEAQYTQTIDYISETFERLDGIRRYWLCLPCTVNSALSPGEQWYPWDSADHDNWLREMPDTPFLVDAAKAFELGFDYPKNMLGRNVRVKFGEWYAGVYGSTAVIVGIRSDESLDRYCAIAKRKHMYKGNPWISEVSNGKATAYPIYDWTLEDIWHYLSYKPYNTLYDLYYAIGIPPREMRVAHPFCLYGVDALKRYKEIDPDMWASMVKRYAGANFAAIYGNTEAMGRGGITLPDGHTWQSYWNHLMASFDEDVREHWQAKMDARVSKCDDEELSELYRNMCLAVMRNDYKCVDVGASKVKKRALNRKAKAAKWKDLL